MMDNDDKVIETECFKADMSVFRNEFDYLHMFLSFKTHLRLTYIIELFEKVGTGVTGGAA